MREFCANPVPPESVANNKQWLWAKTVINRISKEDSANEHKLSPLLQTPEEPGFFFCLQMPLATKT